MTVHYEQEIQWDDEILFAEVSSTFTHRSAVLDARMTKQSARGPDMSRQNRLTKTRPGYKMPRSGGTFAIDFYLGGAQVDTATGALVATDQQLLLASALGGGDLTEVGGLAGATATASALTNATGTRTRGGIIRVGQQLDGRANGQAAVVGNPTTALLTALPGAPNAGDVVRACQMVYLGDTLGTSKRFLLGFRDTGMQYAAHGCHAQSVTIRVTHGDLIVCTIEYQYAYWRELTTAIPSAITLPDCDAAISAGGSYFIQNVGTATRPTDELFAEVEIALNLALVPQIGQGGRWGALQHICGFVRTKSSPTDPIGTLRLLYPWAQQRSTDYDSDGSDSVLKHFLATFSAGDGSAGGEGRHVAAYMPQLYPIGERPSETEWNQLNYQTAMYAMTDGPDDTNALTRSPFRMGLS